MSGKIYELTAANFRVNSKQLTTNVPGELVVLFKLDTCPNTAKFEPIFKAQASMDARVKYGIYNASRDKTVPKISLETAHPIKESPTVFMFFNGRLVSIIHKRTPEGFSDAIGSILQKIHAPPVEEEVASMPFPVEKGFSRKAHPAGAYHTPEGMTNGASGEKVGDDNSNLLLSRDVIPYNKPWEAVGSSEY